MPLDFCCLPVMGSYLPTPCILSGAFSAGRYPRPFSVTMWISTGPTVSVAFTSAASDHTTQGIKCRVPINHHAAHSARLEMSHNIQQHRLSRQPWPPRTIGPACVHGANACRTHGVALDTDPACCLQPAGLIWAEQGRYMH